MLAASSEIAVGAGCLSQQIICLLLQLGDPSLGGVRQVLELLRKRDHKRTHILGARLGLFAQFRALALQFVQPLAGLLLRLGEGALERLGQRISEAGNRVQRGVVGLEG